MDPNNPVPPVAPPTEQIDPNQFDFIMNPQTPVKKSLIPGGPKVKMLLIGLGVITLIVIVIAVATSMLNTTDDTVKAMTNIAQQQNEIIRIAKDGTKKAGSEKSKKLAAVTFSTTTSDQQNVINYLSKQKIKLKEKQLALLANKKNDTELATATSNGRYDDVFTQIILKLLTDYQASLQTTHKTAGEKGKAVLEKSFNNVSLILEDNKTK